MAKLIERIDRDEPSSSVRMQIFALKQATAQELSDTINASLQAILNPPQQTVVREASAVTDKAAGTTRQQIGRS